MIGVEITVTKVEHYRSTESVVIAKSAGACLDALDTTVDALGNAVELFQHDRVDNGPRDAS